MYSYRIKSVHVFFECLDRSIGKWRITAYRIGAYGGYHHIGQSTKAYGFIAPRYSQLNHFRELKRTIRARLNKES